MDLPTIDVSSSLAIIGYVGISLLAVLLFISVIVLCTRRTKRAVLFARRFPQVSTVNQQNSTQHNAAKRFLGFMQNIPKKFQKVVKQDIEKSSLLYNQIEHHTLITPDMTPVAVEECGWGWADGSQAFVGDEAPAQHTEVVERITQLKRRKSGRGKKPRPLLDSTASSGSASVSTPAAEEPSSISLLMDTTPMPVIHFKQNVINSTIYLLQRAASFRDEELSKKNWQTMKDFIVTLRSIFRMEYAASSAFESVPHLQGTINLSAWRTVADLYEKASFSNDEITRHEYVDFMKALNSILVFLNSPSQQSPLRPTADPASVSPAAVQLELVDNSRRSHHR